MSQNECRVCLSLVLVLAGCGNGDPTNTGASGETTDTGSTTESASATLDGEASDSMSGSGNQNGDGDGDPGDGDGDPGDGDGDPGDGDGDGDGDSEEGSAQSEDGGPGICGDGMLDVDEECDDGMLDNGEWFACKGDCTLNVCGDGANGPEEGCDDGNLLAGDGCSATCRFENLHSDAILCGNKIWACGDGMDNDMDGLIDLHDPECTTQCDDNELTFKTDLPGQNMDCKSDCYFDKNSGGGNDGCESRLECDSENPGKGTNCAYDQDATCDDWVNGQPPQQSDECLDVCMPLMPGGCDCFGCCVLGDPNDPSHKTAYLGNAECDLAHIDDCPTCTPNMGCFSQCDEDACEVCFARTPSDLPDYCWGP